MLTVESADTAGRTFLVPIQAQPVILHGTDGESFGVAATYQNVALSLDDSSDPAATSSIIDSLSPRPVRCCDRPLHELHRGAVR
jgi:hypothetical protein